MKKLISTKQKLNSYYLNIFLLLSLYLQPTACVNYVPSKEADNRITFYVSTEGNDNWSGRVADVDENKTDGPFASLEKARDAVRELRNRGNVDVPVYIQLREGTYYIDRTFILRPEDSGTELSPTIYESYPGEKAVISGGKIIDNWEKGEGPLWKAKLPDVQPGSWYFRQLYVNGDRRYRPRYPNEGLSKMVNFSDIGKNDWMAQMTSDISKMSKCAFKFKDGDIQSGWSHIEDAEVVISQFWMESRLKIKTINNQEHIVLFTGEGWRPLSWSFGYHVENVFEEIYNQPGTWYLDKVSGELYYYPMPGENMKKAEVIAPKSDIIQLIFPYSLGNTSGRIFLSPGRDNITCCHFS